MCHWRIMPYLAHNWGLGSMHKCGMLGFPHNRVQGECAPRSSYLRGLRPDPQGSVHRNHDNCVWSGAPKRKVAQLHVWAQQTSLQLYPCVALWPFKLPIYCHWNSCPKYYTKLGRARLAKHKKMLQSCPGQSVCPSSPNKWGNCAIGFPKKGLRDYNWCLL